MSEKTLEELAQVARDWAEKYPKTYIDHPVSDVIHFILSTTGGVNMSHTPWNGETHSGLCAEHPKHEVVRMIYEDGEMIDCILPDMSLLMIRAEELTPIPGTRVDLTPRHESVPESTPDHPTVLTTEKDYESAPTGTIVAADFSDPWVKDDLGFWLVCGEGGSEISRLMTLSSRRVLRWGETL